MAVASSSGRPTHSPSPAPDQVTLVDGRPSRRRVVPPSRFRTSPSPPPVGGPSAGSSSSSSSVPSSSSVSQHQRHPPPPPPSQPQPIQPLPSRARSRLASSAGSSAQSSARAVLPSSLEEASAPKGRRSAAVSECAQSPFPPRHAKAKVVDDDLRDKVLMAVCAALASLVSLHSHSMSRRRGVFRWWSGLGQVSKDGGRITRARASTLLRFPPSRSPPRPSRPQP